MDQRYGSNFRNFMHNFFNHPQTNLLITSFILLISVYASLIAISGQNILHPFSNVTSSTFSVDAVNEFTVSTFSLFFLTILSLIVGKILHYAKIPPLCGALLVGIVVINVPNLEEIFFINKHWEFIARKLGLVNIIVRWGISINAQYISHNPVLPILLGLLSSAAEVAVIILASICIFNISTPMAILTGFLVATVSPAVSGPVMIKLNNKKLGTDKQIPSFVPAACCFDNLFCLTLFSITASATFSTEPLFPTLVRSIGEIVVGAIIGILIGWLLWWFPRQNENYTHLMRSLLLAFLSTAIIIGAAALNYGYPGIIASLLICFISTTRWRFDNEKKALPVERTFNNLWNIVFTPLLFTLVGMKLKFSELTWTIVLISLALIGLGCVARFLLGFIVTSFSSFKFREQFIVVMSMAMKGTVQAALGPSVITMAIGYPQYQEEASFIVTACIIAILVTASIGHFILHFSAPFLLKKNFIQTVHITPEDSYIHTQKVDEPFDSVITFKQFRNLNQIQLENLNGRKYFQSVNHY